MFESEDWNFDEEFLQDADDKAQQFFSQIENEETEVPAKKRKLNEQQSTTNNSKEDSNKVDTSNMSRKNFVLGIFQQNSQKKDDSTIDSKDQKLDNVSQKPSFKNTLQNNISSQRKNIVLDILKKKNVQNIADNKLSSNNSTITSLNSQNQKNVSNEKSEASHSTILQKSNVSSTNLQQSISKNKDDIKQVVSKDSRKCFLMKHLKGSLENNKKHTPFALKTEKQSVKITTLVRKFPGPAGLLPDMINNSTITTSCLSNLEDNESKAVQDQKDTSLIEYCSQDTRTLFSEGAWQIMLNDLPQDFLKDYEIAEIKEIASENQQQCTKVPFLAGIIESIDYSHENPLIVLKDFTDKIEGIIHADIPTNYPGALDKNVVILLQNVGLLRVSGTFVIHKYHILISPSNLLAIYSHKKDIIRTPQMKLLQKELSMIEPSSMNSSGQENEKENLFPKKDNDIDTDSILFSADVNEITDSQNPEKFTNSRSSMNLHKEDNLTRSDAQKQSAHPSGISDDNNSDNKRKHLLELLQKFSPNGKVKNEDKKNIHKETSSLHALTNISAKNNDETENNTKKEKISIKSRLSNFRYEDALTPVESKCKNTNYENESAKKRSSPMGMDWAETILGDSSNDSDDELLSQLDVDSII